MKIKLYVLGCLMSLILLIGSAGAITVNKIPFWQGAWQMGCAMILGLWCFNGIRLEETRTARSRRGRR